MLRRNDPTTSETYPPSLHDALPIWVEANKPLPLIEGLNPAWTDGVAKLNGLVVKPILGDKTSLTIEEWAAICARLGVHDARSEEQTSELQSLAYVVCRLLPEKKSRR